MLCPDSRGARLTDGQRFAFAYPLGDVSRIRLSDATNNSNLSELRSYRVQHVQRTIGRTPVHEFQDTPSGY